MNDKEIHFSQSTHPEIRISTMHPSRSVEFCDGKGFTVESELCAFDLDRKVSLKMKSMLCRRCAVVNDSWGITYPPEGSTTAWKTGKPNSWAPDAFVACIVSGRVYRISPLTS